MTTIKISYLKLNLKTQIVDYNANFANLFSLSNKSLGQKPITTIRNNNSEYLTLKMMQPGDSHSMIIFCNSRINYAEEDNSMLILYALVYRQEQYYSIRIINWLNWLHQMTDSLEHAYGIMCDFNNTTSKTCFQKISDAYCYKALYPLITYIPQKYSSSVSQSSLFEIMRIFVKQRDDSKYSKDYARNVYSRIRTNLKQELNMDNFDAIDVIKNKSLLKIKYNGEIFVPNTLLVDDIVLLVKHDRLLLSVIEAIDPGD